VNKYAALILMLFFWLPSSAQKWYAINKNDVGIMLLGAVSGAADGVNQNLTHLRWGSGLEFWDVKTSWKNKYKDWDAGNTDAAIFGSKTIFVAFTDGFHLTRMIDRTAMLLSVAISTADMRQYPKKDRWKVVAKKMILSAVSNRLAFNIIYK